MNRYEYQFEVDTIANGYNLAGWVGRKFFCDEEVSLEIEDWIS